MLADTRIREARTLLAANELDGAYYLGGYAVECALKAVITKAIPAQILLPAKSIDKLYTHDLQKLAELAELRTELASAPAAVAASWTVVVGWSEQRRYESGIDRASAQGLLESIDDPKDGILPWLKQRW